MKLIIAYTRPESLQQVKQELYQRNIYAMNRSLAALASTRQQAAKSAATWH